MKKSTPKKQEKVIIMEKTQKARPRRRAPVKQQQIVKYVEPERVIHTSKKRKSVIDPQTNRPWYEHAGREIGGFLAKGGAALLKTLTGFGDYEVKTNSLLAESTNGNLGSEIPQMANSPICNLFRHREFIGNVVGSTTDFSSQTFAINPGLDDTFPWGSAIANSFTSYQMRGCVLEYKSLSSEYTSTPYMGFVAMGSQYNVSDLPFKSKKELENSEYSNSCKPSKDMLHPIECSPDQLPLHQLLVRSGSTTDSVRILSDLCNFTIATGGQSSSGIIGELWISYEVACFQPKLGNGTGATVQADHWQRGTNVSQSTPLGWSGSPTTKTPVDGTLGGSCDGTTYFFPKTVTSGTYLVGYTAIMSPSVADATGPTIVVSPGVSLQNGSFGANGAVQSSPYGVGASATTILLLGRIVLDSNSTIDQRSFTIVMSKSLGTSNTVDLYVTQVPSFLREDEKSYIIVNDEKANKIRKKQRDDFLDFQNQMNYLRMNHSRPKDFLIDNLREKEAEDIPLPSGVSVIAQSKKAYKVIEDLKKIDPKIYLGVGDLIDILECNLVSCIIGLDKYIECLSLILATKSYSEISFYKFKDQMQFIVECYECKTLSSD